MDAVTWAAVQAEGMRLCEGLPGPRNRRAWLVHAATVADMLPTGTEYAIRWSERSEPARPCAVVIEACDYRVYAWMEAAGGAPGPWETGGRIREWRAVVAGVPFVAVEVRRRPVPSVSCAGPWGDCG